MYIKGLNGYLSKFEGVEVDAAVERVQGLDAEFALKVDKTTKINGIPLKGDINLTPEDIGSIPAGTGYGKSLLWEDNILHLKDQNGKTLSSEYIEVDLGRWGHIFGNMEEQTDLMEALNKKQDKISPSSMIDADSVDDTNSVHKFVTAEERSQITTNEEDIEEINSKVPAQASSSNQLADKAFVNSSIQTATANFRGNWETWSNVPTDIEQYPQDYEGDKTPTVNDYLVIQDASGYPLETLEGTWRFKYTGKWETEGKDGWIPEYQVNETPLTAEQLAAINSGITSEKVALIDSSVQPDDLGNGTITIKQGTATKGTFTTNQKTNLTIELDDGGEGTWGSITGNINDQTDLMDELDSKQPTTEIFEGTNISVVKNIVDLPAGYKPMKSTYSVSRNAYITTRINLSDVEDSGIEIYAKFVPPQYTNWSLFQAADSSTSIYGIVGDANNSIELRWGSDGIICTSAITRKVNHEYEISAQLYDGIASFDVTDLTTGENDFVEGTYTPTAITSNFCVWSAPGGLIPTGGGCYIDSLDCYTSNQSISYRPCYNSSNVAGFYDINNGEFKTKSGTGTISCSRPLGRVNYTINFNGDVSTSLENLKDVDITNPSQGQNLIYDEVNNKWINASSSATVGWGGITGNINNQTDLKIALEGKSSITLRDWSVS